MTRLSKNDIEKDGVITSEKALGEFSVPKPKTKSRPIELGRQLSFYSLMADEVQITHTRSSVSTESGELLQFDVFARQDFDRIMATVGNIAADQDQLANAFATR